MDFSVLRKILCEYSTFWILNDRNYHIARSFLIQSAIGQVAILLETEYKSSDIPFI